MYQKFVAVGRLGQDPQTKNTTSGTAVSNFSIAVDESYKDKSGNKQIKTEWINVVVWERLATLASEYLNKGSLVLVEGKLQTRSWNDQSTGEKKYKTEVVASVLKFLDKKSDSNPTDEEIPF